MTASPERHLRPDATEQLNELLGSRIMVLDGAMGTAIQRDRPDEDGYRGERFKDWPSDLIGNNDLLTLTQPEIIAGDPPRVPRGRRGHHRDQHVQRERRLPLRLRHGRAGPRAELRGRPAGPPRGRRRHCAHARPAAVRGGGPRPHHPHRLHQPRRQRPGRPQRLLRRPGGRLPERRPRTGRGWRRPDLHRDDLRHPQRQGRDLRGRDAVRGGGPAVAGGHLRHHHRRFRAHPLGPGHRGVLGLGAARPAARGRPQLRPRRQGDAALPRRAVPGGRHVGVGVPQRGPAQRVR